MARIYLKHIRTILTKGGLVFNTRKQLINNSPIVFVNSKSYICTSSVSLAESEHPIKRTFRIFADDFKGMKDILLGNTKFVKPKIFPTHCDVLIIGGGVMGFSIAYWLQQRALEGLKIVVVEKDPSVKSYNSNITEYMKSTSALSVGGIRQQFSLKENIELSLYSAEFLRNIKHHLAIEGEDPPDINFNPSGYLFLATEKSAQIVTDNVRLQRSLGAKVELLAPDMLKEKFPWMNTDGVAIASHGLENEGWFDPWALLHAFKRKALHLGVEYVIGEVTNFGFEKNERVIQPDRTEPDTSGSIRNVIITLPDGTEKKIGFAICVLAAGAMSGQVAELAGMGKGPWPRSAGLPVEPRKRYVHVVHCPEGPGFNCPFLIDYTGAYLRREGIGGNYVCGISPVEEEEPPIDNLDVDCNYFEERVWPIIAHRVPAFEKCKLKNSWAGFYDFNSFDENAFIGVHPGYYNLILATGFSGHGIQQAPAIGRAVMEMICDGGFQTIDLSRLGYQRFIDDEPLWESNIV